MEKINGEHEWVYQYSVCCSHTLRCRKCKKITKAKNIVGDLQSGDLVNLDQDEIATKIRMGSSKDILKEKKRVEVNSSVVP